MDRRDIMRIAGETGADPRTVAAWASGERGVSAATDYAMRMACRVLALPVPRGARVDDEAPADDEAPGPEAA